MFSTLAVRVHTLWYS